MFLWPRAKVQTVLANEAQKDIDAVMTSNSCCRKDTDHKQHCTNVKCAVYSLQIMIKKFIINSLLNEHNGNAHFHFYQTTSTHILN